MSDDLKRLRLLGCRVLIGPMNDEQVSALGIIAPNKYSKTNQHFVVLAVGPGEWWRIRKGKCKWIAVEVFPGDRVISQHWLSEPAARWHKPEHLDREDQRSRVILDCRYLKLVWRQDARAYEGALTINQD